MVEIKKNKFFLIGFVLISGLLFIRCASSEKLPPEKEAEKPAGENVSVQKENEARIAVQEKEIQKKIKELCELMDENEKNLPDDNAFHL